MRRVELMSGIESSAIGFGCAPILGAVGAQAADRAINVALDAGINHFDLARSYGYGRAEATVGRILRGKRDQVVLATKFGIEASAAARLFSPLKPLIRALRRWPFQASAPGNSPLSPARPPNRLASTLLRPMPLDSATMIRSLEASLQALGTDRVEYLFVHAPTESIANIYELAAAAALLKTQGKIRGWGLAFYYEGQARHSSYLPCFDLLQFNSPSVSTYDEVCTARRDQPNVFFSPFRQRLQGAEPLSPAATLRLLLADFPRSVVLCSMFDEAHIRENAAAVAAV